MLIYWKNLIHLSFWQFVHHWDSFVCLVSLVKCSWSLNWCATSMKSIMHFIWRRRASNGKLIIYKMTANRAVWSHQHHQHQHQRRRHFLNIVISIPFQKISVQSPTHCWNIAPMATIERINFTIQSKWINCTSDWENWSLNEKNWISCAVRRHYNEIWSIHWQCWPYLLSPVSPFWWSYKIRWNYWLASKRYRWVHG